MKFNARVVGIIADKEKAKIVFKSARYGGAYVGILPIDQIAEFAIDTPVKLKTNAAGEVVSAAVRDPRPRR